MDSTRLILFTAALVAGAGRLQAQTTGVDSTTSPLIRQLTGDLARGDAGAESRFWSRVARGGAPIVESIAGEENVRLVTFVYRADSAIPGALAVLLQNDQLANEAYYRRARMYHLGGTGIWYRTYRLPSDARFSYRVGPDFDGSIRAYLSDSAWARKVSRLTADPFNTVHTMGPSGAESVVELPHAPGQKWIVLRNDIPHGRVESRSFTSSILGNTRVLQVYLPPGGSARAAKNLLFVLDGEGVPDALPLPTILDNMMGEGVIQPTMAVMIGNAEGARNRELWYGEEFARAVREEIVPLIQREYGLALCPDHCAIAGRSLGGSAAMFLGFRLSDVFHGVIAQSGGFLYARTTAVWAAPQPADGLMETGFPQQEWLTGEFSVAQRKPLRIYLEAGTMEDVEYQGAPMPRYALTNVLTSTRHLRDVLVARGYPLRYREYTGIHRPLNWRGSFGDAVGYVFGESAH